MADNNQVYAQRHYEASLDFFEQGQYEKALEQIKKAIKRVPNNPDYISTKAVFYHKMNDLSFAIETYLEVLTVDPNHIFTHFNLGLIYMKMGKINDAIREWETVLKINPNDVSALFNIAVAISQSGRCREAIAFFEKVLLIDPNHIQSHQNLGIIYRDERAFGKAKLHLNRLRELDSTYAELVSSEIRKCEELEFLDRLTDSPGKIDENLSGIDEKGPLSQALMAILTDNFTEAMSIAEKILEQNPGDLQARIILGQAMAGTGRTNDAIAQFMGLTSDSPDCAEAYFHLGNIFLGLGELEKSLEYFERVQRLDANYPLISANIESIRNQLDRKA